MDIKNLLRSANIQLEANAATSLGAAIGDYLNGNQASSQASTGGGTGAGGNAAGNGSGQSGGADSNGSIAGSTAHPYRKVFGEWQSPTYAADLVEFAPKHRFMFKVQFVFTDAYQEQVGGPSVEFAYVVKSIDKPKVTFDYEDVNMYNFRTQVLKSIKHEPLNMSFHDDIKNSVVDFFNSYRTAFSPISSMTDGTTFETAGMNFNDPNIPGKSYSASRGVLRRNSHNIEEKSVLKYISLKQIYGHGSKMTEFVFINPRITTFDFDNVDHEAGGDGSSVSVQFGYDSLHLVNTTVNTTPMPKWGKTDVFGNGAAPSNYEAPGQVPPGLKPFTDPIIGLGGNIIAGSIGEQFNRTGLNKIPGLSNSVTKAAVTPFADKMNRTLASVAASVQQSFAGLSPTTKVNDSFVGEKEVGIK